VRGTLTKKVEKRVRKTGEIVSKKGAVDLDEYFRELVREVKALLQEEYKSKRMDSSLSVLTFSQHKRIQDVLEKHRIKKGKGKDAVANAFSYIGGRRIIMDEAQKEDGTRKCIFLDIYVETGGALAYRFMDEASWAKKYGALREEEDSIQ
jgi:hypothetical protein